MKTPAGLPPSKIPPVMYKPPGAAVRYTHEDVYRKYSARRPDSLAPPRRGGSSHDTGGGGRFCVRPVWYEVFTGPNDFAAPVSRAAMPELL